jgi:hypothetical protein
VTVEQFGKDSAAYKSNGCGYFRTTNNLRKIMQLG